MPRQRWRSKNAIFSLIFSQGILLGCGVDNRVLPWLPEKGTPASEDAVVEEAGPLPSGAQVSTRSANGFNAKLVATGNWQERARVGVVITSYNRPELLRITLESLKYSGLAPGDAKIVIVDGASDGKVVRDVINTFEMSEAPIMRIFADQNLGPVAALRYGADELGDSVDYLTNLDPDVYLKKGWLRSLIDTYQEIGEADALLTGFNEPVRHKILSCGRQGVANETNPSYCEKEVIGAVHYFYSTSFYQTYLRAWLASQEYWRGWDWRICSDVRERGGHLYTTIPSVVQHLGVSGVNHGAVGTIDFAPDF